MERTKIWSIGCKWLPKSETGKLKKLLLPKVLLIQISMFSSVNLPHKARVHTLLWSDTFLISLRFNRRSKFQYQKTLPTKKPIKYTPQSTVISPRHLSCHLSNYTSNIIIFLIRCLRHFWFTCCRVHLIFQRGIWFVQPFYAWCDVTKQVHLIFLAMMFGWQVLRCQIFKYSSGTACPHSLFLLGTGGSPNCISFPSFFPVVGVSSAFWWL